MEDIDDNIGDILRDRFLPSINREGWLIIGGFVVATIILFVIYKPLGFIFLILSIWSVYFFRDPKRVTPDISEDMVISPADGVILPIHLTPPPESLSLGEDKMHRISIFMDIFSVHVNRMPISGQIKSMSYNRGKFLSASSDKASSKNENMSLCIKGFKGSEIGLVLIAGFLARRIKCWVREGQERGAGERIGIIRFGSRVDIYLPLSSNILVKSGQISVAGESVLARLSPKPARKSKERII